MSESPIDQTALDNLIASTDKEFVKDLIDTFLEDAPRLLADMRQALKDNDPDAFRRAAHSLKSNAASFGALSLSAQAKELEQLAKTGTLDGARGRLEQLAAAYEPVQHALKAWQHDAN